MHELRGEALIRALQGGGYTLLFRHAVRDTRFLDQGDRLVMSDCATQSPLSEIGRNQSRSIGAAMQKLQIPLGEVIASPYCRTMNTAKLIAGHARAENAVAGHNPERIQEDKSFVRLGQIIATPPAAGTNRLIIGHVDGLAAMAGSHAILEGEAAIFRAVDGGRVLVGRMRAEDWQTFVAPVNAVSASTRSSLPDPLLELRGQPLINALHAGGYTVYFRYGDASQQGTVPFEAADCAGQRNLSDAILTQATRIGEIVSKLRLPITEVIASPDCRSMEIARLLGGRATADDAVRGKAPPGGGPMDFTALVKLVAQPVATSGLRFIVGTADGFRATLGMPEIAEGEGEMLRVSDTGNWVVVARIRPMDWDEFLEILGLAPRKGG